MGDLRRRIDLLEQSAIAKPEGRRWLVIRESIGGDVPDNVATQLKRIECGGRTWGRDGDESDEEFTARVKATVRRESPGSRLMFAFYGRAFNE
jgi:hypothetical protein